MEEEPPADCTGGDGPGPPEYCVSTEPFLHHPAGDPRGEDTGGTTQQTGPTARGHAGGWTGKLCSVSDTCILHMYLSSTKTLF